MSTNRYFATCTQCLGSPHPRSLSILGVELYTKQTIVKWVEGGRKRGQKEPG